MYKKYVRPKRILVVIPLFLYKRKLYRGKYIHTY